MGLLNLLLAMTFAQGPAAWRDPSPHRAQFVTVEPGVKLEVLDWGGSGRPAIVLACYLTAHVYDDVGPKLAAGYHVYGITRRGLGASDKPTSGYTIQRSADDVLAVIDALRLQQPVLIGNSCAGWTMTMLAVQHGDRLGGMVFLDAADDPTLTAADYNAPPVDTAHMPKSIKPPPQPDYSSFEAYRIAQRRDHGVAFPESELRQLFEARADGSMGRSLLSPTVREAITRGDLVKPDYAHVRVPLLAIFRVPPEMPELEREFPPQNDEERRALQQERASGLAMVRKWEKDVRAGIPNAQIVELSGANLYMFLSNEADVLRELRAFVGALQRDVQPAKPVEPISAIISALGTHDVVGSDLGHSGAESEHALLITLVRDPRFPGTATDLVMEGLSARFQDAMDRYVRGETVPEAQLKPIWNDTTQPQVPGPMWSGSVPPLFQAVRAVNATLPRASQIRVLLGDPPIEWENVHTAADFQRWLEQRDSFPAEQIRRDILAKGRHALALFGGGHLQRKQQATNYLMDHPLAQTVVSLVERGGASTFLVHNRFEEPAARGWPVPSLAIIRGTDLGAQPVPEGSIPRVSIGADGRMIPLPRDQWISMRQEEQFDAVVYTGVAGPAPVLSSTICDDPAFVRTRLERMKLAGLPPSVPDRLRSLCGTP